MRSAGKLKCSLRLQPVQTVLHPTCISLTITNMMTLFIYFNVYCLPNLCAVITIQLRLRLYSVSLLFLFMLLCFLCSVFHRGRGSTYTHTLHTAKCDRMEQGMLVFLAINVSILCIGTYKTIFGILNTLVVLIMRCNKCNTHLSLPWCCYTLINGLSSCIVWERSSQL